MSKSSPLTPSCRPRRYQLGTGRRLKSRRVGTIPCGEGGERNGLRHHHASVSQVSLPEIYITWHHLPRQQIKMKLWCKIGTHWGTADSPFRYISRNLIIGGVSITIYDTMGMPLLRSSFNSSISILQESGNQMIQSCASHILNVPIILASVLYTRNISWRVIH